VLDFYVHEHYQRQGVGKALFEVREPAHAPAADAPAAAAELAQHLFSMLCKHIDWQQQLPSLLAGLRSPMQMACVKRC
jgi:GNAT superfamily N-acetyltransferase